MSTRVQRGDERRRRARRSAWLLGGIAIAFYVAFIVMSLKSGHA